MTSEERRERSKAMAKIACDALADKKASNIRVIDIAEVSVIADYFVVANGANPNQIRTLVEEVEEKLHKAGYPLNHQEGNSASTWILLDFEDIIVHVFSEEDRTFYNLEKIWSDGKLIDAEDL